MHSILPTLVLGASAVVAGHVAGGNQHQMPRRARQFGGELKHERMAKRQAAYAQLLAVSDSDKSTSNAKPSASQTYTSTGLWSSFGGRESACLNVNQDSDLIFGVPLTLWDITKGDGGPNPDFCGKTVNVTNTDNGKSILAKLDENSGRAQYSLMSIGAFEGLGVPLETGMIPIEFFIVDAPFSSNSDNNVAAAAVAAAGASTSSSVVSEGQIVAASPTSSRTSVPLAAAKVTSAPTQAPTSSVSADVDDGKSFASAASAKAFAAAAQASSASVESAQDAEASASQAAASKSSAAAAAASASSASAAAAQASQDAEAKKEALAEAAAAASSKAADAAASASASLKAAAAEASQRASDAAKGAGKLWSGGSATYYLQHNTAGNCGTVAQDSDYVIALPTNTYQGGQNCGRKIRATRVSNGASVVGTVRDSCPTCDNDSCLDMSVAMFEQIATQEEGQVSITWQYID